MLPQEIFNLMDSQDQGIGTPSYGPHARFMGWSAKGRKSLPRGQNAEPFTVNPK